MKWDCFNSLLSQVTHLRGDKGRVCSYREADNKCKIFTDNLFSKLNFLYFFNDIDDILHI